MFFLLLDTLEEKERSFAEELYYKYCRHIYKIALSIVKNHHDAEDVLDSVMVSIMENMDKFISREKAVIEAQIVIYSRNAAINLYKKNQRRSSRIRPLQTADENGTSWEDIKDESADTEEIVLSRETAEIIRKYLVMLPDEYRDVINLVYALGYSYREAAEVLHITTDLVGIRLYRAKKKLKELAGGELSGRK